jgi:DNA helicase IV
VRSAGFGPSIVAAQPDEKLEQVAVRSVADLRALIGAGTIGVITPDALVEPMVAALRSAGVTHDRGDGTTDLSVIAVRTAKGLEFDGVVVVEPAQIVGNTQNGLRALYVAMTRPTQALTIVHTEPLPECLRVV